jgi:hypothetical protein
MSEVTPGADGLAAAAAGGWPAFDASAVFVSFVATAGGCTDETGAFERTAELASDPPVMYGWLGGVIAGN